MRRVRARSGHRAVGVGVTAAADTAARGKVASEGAIRFWNHRPQGKYGQGWIRTSEGVKPADLQSAPFGHFGTYPSSARDFIYPRAPQLATRIRFPAAIDRANPTVTF